MFEVGNIVRVKNEEFICCICEIVVDEDDGKTYCGIFPIDFAAHTRFVAEDRLEKVVLTRPQYNELLEQKKAETDFNNREAIHAYNEFARVMRKCIVKEYV